MLPWPFEVILCPYRGATSATTRYIPENIVEYMERKRIEIESQLERCLCMLWFEGQPPRRSCRESVLHLLPRVFHLLILSLYCSLSLSSCPTDLKLSSSLLKSLGVLSKSSRNDEVTFPFPIESSSTSVTALNPSFAPFCVSYLCHGGDSGVLEDVLLGVFGLSGLRISVVRFSGVRFSGVRLSGVLFSGLWKNGFDGVGGEGFAFGVPIGFLVIDPIDREGTSRIPRP
jgi:hypothetical protein